MWEIATGLYRSRLGDNFGMINAIAFLLDESLVASASFDDTIVVWEVVMTGLLRRVIKSRDRGTEGVVTVAFSPDGWLVAPGAINGGMQVWEVATGLCSNVIEGHITSLAFSPDEQLITLISKGCSLKVWEVAMGLCHIVIDKNDNQINTVTFSPDGSLIALGASEGTVCLREVTGRHVLGDYEAILAESSGLPSH